MKKALFLAVLALPYLASASIDQNLKYGMSNPQVSELQDLLGSEGCLSVSPTGFFGLLTLKGVQCFQAKYGIEATGYFGALSRAQANKIISDATVDSDKAASSEVGTSTQIIACGAGDLFNMYTGAPCTSTSIQQTIDTAVNNAITKITNTIGQNTVGSQTVGGVTPSVTVSLGAQECKVDPDYTGTTTPVAEFTVVTSGKYDGGVSRFFPSNGTPGVGDQGYGEAWQKFPNSPDSYIGVHKIRYIAPDTYNVTINLYNQNSYPPSILSKALGGSDDAVPVATYTNTVTVTPCQ